MNLRLYNTLTRQKEDFAPIDPQHVRMYVCGPTVYDYAHIGNARPVIVFDVLYRLLRHVYGADHVTYARNITDVDDKINARAARDYPTLPLNDAIAKVTSATQAQFLADVDALGCLRPDAQPRATEHIGDMIALIERLIARQHAYVADGHVLFDVPSMPSYGGLSKRTLKDMIAGARVDVAPYKKGEMDFVLWKPSSTTEPGWESPWGRGRPGWHIECSAMSMKKLLEPFGGGLSCDDPMKNMFDIHGGGIDLVFPHHENEIAQSCCAFGSDKMANIWMHNGFLQVEGEKMSKSLGNFITINELLTTTKFGGRSWPGEVLRLAMLKTHYRQPIDWTVTALEEAEKMLISWHDADGFDEAMAAEAPSSLVVRALCDDLNTAEVIREVHVLRKTGQISALKCSLHFLGLYNHSQFARQRNKFASLHDSRPENHAHITTLITARLAARAAKNWAESDRIRDELAAMGVALKDVKDENGNPTTTWEVTR